MFLPLLLRDRLTTGPAGRHSYGFCKLIVWEASHHFILPRPAHSQTSRTIHLSAFKSKAEFTARPLLRQQIPARCRSLRLLSCFFFLALREQEIITSHYCTAFLKSPRPPQQAEEQAPPRLVSKSSCFLPRQNATRDSTCKWE